jgi:hypothetical protein
MPSQFALLNALFICLRYTETGKLEHLPQPSDFSTLRRAGLI